VQAGIDIARTCCAYHYQATVLNDTIRLQGQIIDIPPGRGGRGYARKHVEVVQLLDATWRVYSKDELIAVAKATVVDDLRVRRRRKRSATDRAFGRAIRRIAASLPTYVQAHDRVPCMEIVLTLGVSDLLTR
jgi:hypothetical protein